MTDQSLADRITATEMNLRNREEVARIAAERERYDSVPPEIRAASAVTGMKPSEIAGLRSHACGVIVDLNVGGPPLIIVDPTTPDADGQSGVMLYQEPNYAAMSTGPGTSTPTMGHHPHVFADPNAPAPVELAAEPERPKVEREPEDVRALKAVILWYAGLAGNGSAYQAAVALYPNVVTFPSDPDLAKREYLGALETLHLRGIEIPEVPDDVLTPYADSSPDFPRR